MNEKILKDSWNENHPSGIPQSNIIMFHLKNLVNQIIIKVPLLSKKVKHTTFIDKTIILDLVINREHLDVENKDAYGKPIYVPHRQILTTINLNVLVE